MGVLGSIVKSIMKAGSTSEWQCTKCGQIEKFLVWGMINFLQVNFVEKISLILLMESIAGNT